MAATRTTKPAKPAITKPSARKRLTPTQPPEQQEMTFAQEFAARVRRIEQRAKAVGLTWTSLCAAGGIARATPDRWLRSTPKTVQLVDEFESMIREAEAEAVRQRDEAAAAKKAGRTAKK